MNILLDYFFKVTAILGAQAASTAFLKQVLVVVKPKTGQEGNVGTIYTCTSQTQVAARTDNLDVQQLFNAGMSRVYLLLSNNLELAAYIAGNQSFYTILISSDFADSDVTLSPAYGIATITSYANLVSGTDDAITVQGVALTAQTGAAVLGEATFQAATSNDATAASLAAQINAHPTLSPLVLASVVGAVVTITALVPGVEGNDITLTYTDNDTNVGATLSHLSAGKFTGGAGLDVGTFKGVVGIYSNDKAKAKTYGTASKRHGFYDTTGNKAKNMFFAFGKLLSNASDWKNQQYIEMPFASDVDELGEADALFDDKVSFVIDDDEFGTRLGLFVAGGRAIVAPYIARNLEIDLQSRALTYVTANQPAYTPTQAALLEDELTKVIDNSGAGSPGYIQRGWILTGKVEITLVNQNFVANGNIAIQDAGALWRVAANMIQS